MCIDNAVAVGVMQFGAMAMLHGNLQLPNLCDRSVHWAGGD